MTKQEHIDDIMDNFDFNKVAKVMKYLKWEWASSVTGVPEEPELRRSCRQYLSMAYDAGIEYKKGYRISTGGFVYSYHPEFDELRLVFEVTGWCSNNGAAF